MTTLREAAQMALDALEESKKHLTDQRRDKTIEALRAALANEFNPDWDQVEALQESLREHMAEIQRLRDRLAQPEQEPTAYLCENAVGHKYFRWKKPSSEYKPIALYTAPLQREWETLVESVRQMRDVQGMDGNWNCDHYMHGLFNGIEFALSLIEVREPKFKDTPEKWLCDQPKARIFSGGNNG